MQLQKCQAKLQKGDSLPLSMWTSRYFLQAGSSKPIPLKDVMKRYDLED